MAFLLDDLPELERPHGLNSSSTSSDSATDSSTRPLTSRIASNSQGSRCADRPTIELSRHLCGASIMATFYVIPPRECLEQALVEFLGRVLPGVPTSPAVVEAFLGALELEANRAEDVFFIHREDLGGFDDPVRELIEAFGAEPGDQVIEIGATVSSRPATLRRCTVRERVSEMPAVR